MPPISFSDEELDLLSALASAPPPSARGAFLEIVSNKLGAYPQEARGSGLLHRIAAEAQRDFLKAGSVAIGAVRQVRSRAIAASRASAVKVVKAVKSA